MSSPLLPAGHMLQEPQGMLETMESTKPYTNYVFFLIHKYILTIKFNFQIKHSKRITLVLSTLLTLSILLTSNKTEQL